MCASSLELHNNATNSASFKKLERERKSGSLEPEHPHQRCRGGTNNEFGFDYLRDNMKFYSEQLVQRELNYAIVDEVDSILIDEARTPLIISGQAEDSTSMYEQINRIIPKLRRDEDFTLDEKSRTATLTDDGVVHCEEILGLNNLFDPANITVQHHIFPSFAV